ncbi:TPA: SDR family oxidoreductase [Candidatus Galligastranaerophilus intestinigallinarum]|nr:SDR family oxidoreductase [Candidatus Galligastranaerophilus intestinigallinarum]
MKNILITGSSSGIGKVAAETLKAEGYKVFQTGRKLLDIENYISINLSDPNNVNKLYNCVKENFGDIDILINNAGEYVYSPIDKMKPDEIIQIFNSNFISHYYLTSLVVPYMKQKKFGRIVNIASISGVVGEANASLYSATKSAYFGFSKALALELAEYNITVNSISPGWVETQLTENALSEEEKKETLDVIPQKRFVEPVEVANLIKYLISDNAKGITGQNINLCAGLSCGC